jgi:hypothetical protein
MGFEDLWEKYGDQETKKSTRRVCTDENTVNIEPTIKKKEKENIPHEPINYKPVKEKSTSSLKKEKTTPIGVFGNEKDIPIEEHIPKIHRRRKNFNFSTLRDWPWVDIVFVSITILMIIGVAVNFEEVTTAIFNMLLPLLCNIVILLVVVGLIVAFIWWITRNFRRPRRRW